MLHQCRKMTMFILWTSFLSLFAILGKCEDIHINIRHKSLESLLGSNRLEDKIQQPHNSRRSAYGRRFPRGPASSFQSTETVEDSLPEPHLLDPKDVAVLYQLQTVTQSPKNASEHEGSKPFIVEPATRHITTRAGQTAALTCTVTNLGDRQVSWIRGRDLHVLSSGTRVFATDTRVRVTVAGSRWTLFIRYSQPKDGGLYTCQVNTENPIAIWLNLTVIEAKAIIDGPSTLYIQEGSTITLSCTIKEELVIPGLVLWYHGDALVPRDSERIKAVTETTDFTYSVLNITRATTSDSGNYSCWPSSGKPDTVFVHVIQGDPPAAVQHGNSPPRPCPGLWFLVTLLTRYFPTILSNSWLT